MDSILRASNLIDVEELLEPRPPPPPALEAPTREVGKGATPADLETVAALAAGDVVTLASHGGASEQTNAAAPQQRARRFGDR